MSLEPIGCTLTSNGNVIERKMQIDYLETSDTRANVEGAYAMDFQGARMFLNVSIKGKAIYSDVQIHREGVRCSSPPPPKRHKNGIVFYHNNFV